MCIGYNNRPISFMDLKNSVKNNYKGNSFKTLQTYDYFGVVLQRR